MTRIGVSTIFYGYKGDIVPKIECLAKVFQGIGKVPFIQIGASEIDGNFLDTRRRILELQQLYGIQFTIHQSLFTGPPWGPKGFILNIASSDYGERNRSVFALKQSIDLAIDVGATKVSFHGGYATNNITQDQEYAPMSPSELIPKSEAYNNVEKSLEELLDFNRDRITLEIENNNSRPERGYLFSEALEFLVRNAKPIRDAKEPNTSIGIKLDKRIGVVLNLGHLYYNMCKMSGDSDYQNKFINFLQERIHEVHVSDNNGLEDEHKFVGRGSAPIASMLKDLSQMNRDRSPDLILEVHGKRYGYTDSDLSHNILLLSQSWEITHYTNMWDRLRKIPLIRRA